MTSPEILEPLRWSEARGPLSEEAVRGLHLPNYRHRFSLRKYASGTGFAGRQRASTCYVLSGSCEFSFGERSIALGAGYFAALPAGEFTFRVVDQSDFLLLCVFALPFDVVYHRRDGIEYLEDPKYDEAVRVVLTTGQASASYLQRRLKLGYSRAARLIEIMEANGVVGPSQGSKPREILIRADDYPPASGQI